MRVVGGDGATIGRRRRRRRVEQASGRARSVPATDDEIDLFSEWPAEPNPSEDSETTAMAGQVLLSILQNRKLMPHGRVIQDHLVANAAPVRENPQFLVEWLSSNKFSAGVELTLSVFYCPSVRAAKPSMVPMESYSFIFKKDVPCSTDNDTSSSLQALRDLLSELSLNRQTDIAVLLSLNSMSRISWLCPAGTSATYRMNRVLCEPELDHIPVPGALKFSIKLAQSVRDVLKIRLRVSPTLFSKREPAKVFPLNINSLSAYSCSDLRASNDVDAADPAVDHSVIFCPEPPDDVSDASNFKDDDDTTLTIPGARNLCQEARAASLKANSERDQSPSPSEKDSCSASEWLPATSSKPRARSSASRQGRRPDDSDFEDSQRPSLSMRRQQRLYNRVRKALLDTPQGCTVGGLTSRFTGVSRKALAGAVAKLIEKGMVHKLGAGRLQHRQYKRHKPPGLP